MSRLTDEIIELCAPVETAPAFVKPSGSVTLFPMDNAPYAKREAHLKSFPRQESLVKSFFSGKIPSSESAHSARSFHKFGESRGKYNIESRIIFDIADTTCSRGHVSKYNPIKAKPPFNIYSKEESSEIANIPSLEEDISRLLQTQAFLSNFPFSVEGCSARVSSAKIHQIEERFNAREEPKSSVSKSRGWFHPAPGRWVWLDLSDLVARNVEGSDFHDQPSPVERLTKPSHSVEL